MIWLGFPSNSLVNCEGVGESKFGRLERKLCTLSTLCTIGTFLVTVRSAHGGARSAFIWINRIRIHKKSGSTFASASTTLDLTVKKCHNFISYCYCPGSEETGGHMPTSTSQPRLEVTPLLQPWTGQQRILEKPQPGHHSSNGALSSATVLEEATDDFVAKRTRGEACLTQESLLAAASRTKPSVSQTELQKYHTM